MKRDWHHDWITETDAAPLTATFTEQELAEMAEQVAEMEDPKAALIWERKINGQRRPISARADPGDYDRFYYVRIYRVPAWQRTLGLYRLLFLLGIGRYGYW